MRPSAPGVQTPRVRRARPPSAPPGPVFGAFGPPMVWGPATRGDCSRTCSATRPTASGRATRGSASALIGEVGPRKSSSMQVSCKPIESEPDVPGDWRCARRLSLEAGSGFKAAPGQSLWSMRSTSTSAPRSCGPPATWSSSRLRASEAGSMSRPPRTRNGLQSRSRRASPRSLATSATAYALATTRSSSWRPTKRLWGSSRAGWPGQVYWRAAGSRSCCERPVWKRVSVRPADGMGLDPARRGGRGAYGGGGRGAP